jgi:hypothetical protein
VREHFPAASRALGIDRDDDALRAEAAGGLLDKRRVLHRRGVDRNLVGAGVEEPPDVLYGPHSAADGKRDKHLRRDILHDVHDRVALVRAGGDVEKAELVGALLVIAARDLDRVAGVAQVHEVDALHHAPGVDVEAGDDALRECHGWEKGETRRASPRRFYPSSFPFPVLSASARACAALKSTVP